MSLEAMAVPQSHGLAPNRALVNEDKSTHMERQHASMSHFRPRNPELRYEKFRERTFGRAVVAAMAKGQNAMHAVGNDLAGGCREALCGSCEVDGIDGEIDHRNGRLTRTERAESTRMMACCSRGNAGLGFYLAIKEHDAHRAFSARTVSAAFPHANSGHPHP